MSEENEQNKTEDPTPFKLKKAREKGNIAKGTDLPFFAVLLGLAFFMLTAGNMAATRLSYMMKNSLVTAGHSETNADIYRAISDSSGAALWVVVIVGCIMLSSVLLAQIIQTKGLLFSAHPMKPEMNKLNPAKGLKRIFSIRTLKETIKNCFKMLVYLVATFLVIRFCILQFSNQLDDADRLISAMNSSALRLLYVYLALSLVFAAIDQIIVRREYFKQMRMSKSELKREIKDREGEPRIKQKRKQLHEEFSKQTASIGELDGSDIVIVNPQHFAVALKYTPGEMSAPVMTTKGRNKIALNIKSRAFNLGIPIISNPPLARALFRGGRIGEEIPGDQFFEVANIYIKLRRDKVWGQNHKVDPQEPKDETS